MSAGYITDGGKIAAPTPQGLGADQSIPPCVHCDARQNKYCAGGAACEGFVLYSYNKRPGYKYMPKGVPTTTLFNKVF